MTMQDDDEYTQKLRDALLKYFSKYKSQKIAIKELVDVTRTNFVVEPSSFLLTQLEYRHRQNSRTATPKSRKKTRPYWSRLIELGRYILEIFVLLRELTPFMVPRISARTS